MDRNRRNDTRDQRENNRVPYGLNLLMWSALVRAPWLLGSIGDNDADHRRRAAERRRHEF